MEIGEGAFGCEVVKVDEGSGVMEFRSGSEFRIGRWSELSVVRVDQEAVMAMFGR